jgi:hypothetical protein
MPTQPGKHTLPAFTLHWWDTVTDSEQVATLPERVIEVLAAAGQQQNPAAAFNDFAFDSGDTNSQQAGQHAAQGMPANPLLPSDRTSNAANTITASAVNHSGWFWVSLLFAALWLVTLGLWWNSKRHRVFQAGDEKASGQEPGNSRKARKHFLAACKDNNSQQARHFLLKWAACHWPEAPPRGLDELSSRLNDPAINAALTQLDRVLYQDNPESWDGRELAKLVSEFPKTAYASGNNKSRSTLPGLYS